jgi:hypothetical protein
MFWRKKHVESPSVSAVALTRIRNFRNAGRWPPLSRSALIHQRSRRLAQCRPTIPTVSLPHRGWGAEVEPARTSRGDDWLAAAGLLVMAVLVVAAWMVFPADTSRQPAYPSLSRPPSLVLDAGLFAPLSDETAIRAARLALVSAGLPADNWEAVERATPDASAGKFLERPIPTDPNYGAICFRGKGATWRVTLFVEGARLTCTVYPAVIESPNPDSGATAAQPRRST